MLQWWARGLVLTLPAVAVAITAFSIAATAQALNEKAVSQRIEETYSVKVLRVRDGKHNGDSVYIVTVMNPGGDFNEAFQVSTLAVDRRSGRLISQFRHTPTGHVFSGADSRSPSIDESGTVIRQWSHRPAPHR